jgi:Leucine-rich repeat (LRR) protein
MREPRGSKVLRLLLIIAGLFVFAGAESTAQASVGQSWVDVGSIPIHLDQLPAPLAVPPSNDDFDSPTAIGSLPYTNTITTIEATIEPDEPTYSCGNSLDASVWYSYSPGSTAFIAIDTNGSGFNTVVHVFRDLGGGSISLETCDDNSGEGLNAQAVLEVQAGETYYISVAGYGGAKGSMTINVHQPAVYTDCSAVADVTEPECQALVDLYTSTAGASWTNHTAWLETNEVCTWWGVLCSSGALYQINLYDNNLVGPFDGDFTSATSITHFSAGANQISGTMSAVIAALPTSLQVLSLQYNDLTGTFPAGLASFSNLYYLYLEHNLLDGDLPTMIANLPGGITYLLLQNNQITGGIPSSISSLTSLYNVKLNDNLLSGDLDPMLGYIPTSVNFLTLSNNDFTGTISTGVASLINVKHLDVRGNLLDGDLSAIIDALPANVDTFYISNNLLTGGIPESIADKTALLTLDISFNAAVTGPIPLSITSSSLTYFNFSYTDLCEPWSDAYQSWKSGISYYGTGIVCPRIFEDDFETGDFSLWSRVNLGGGFLTTCPEAAINGSWGTCVDRGTNDKRKVLIDDTPVDQTSFDVRFNMDINSFSMPDGTRFRFLEAKRGLPRAFFLVLRKFSGQYQIQLNILVDGGIKYKSGWYTLSDAPHTIEIDWQASSADGANDGYIQLYMDDGLLEEMTGLDNDTHIVSSLRIGFIGRLDGSPISGIWHVDDVATSNLWYIGLP